MCHWQGPKLSVNVPPVARSERPSSGTDTVASPSPSTVNVAFVVPLRGWAASPSDIAKTYACPPRYLVSVVTVVETPETVTASPRVELFSTAAYFVSRVGRRDRPRARPVLERV